MIIDGRALGARILGSVRERIGQAAHRPHLTVIACAPSFATKQYIALKRRKAAEVGITVEYIELPPDSTTESMVTIINRASVQTDGILVQLPLPPHIDTTAVLAAIPPTLDVDGMHYIETSSGFLPPVIGAIAAIAASQELSLGGTEVVVVGHGRLVGQPAAVWARQQGARVSVITAETADAKHLLRTADILILGAGVPGLIKPEEIKEGVIIFDAGTSEDGGQLKGDADPACAEKAALFTPVPGGIGPLTVATLLENVTVAAYGQVRG